MGDRVSISFKNGNEESVAFFSHWDGRELPRKARAYVKHLKQYLEKREMGSGFDPLGRMEPNTVMVDFIREYTKDLPRVESNYYLGKDYSDGDNSNQGHFIIRLDFKDKAEASESESAKVK